MEHHVRNSPQKLPSPPQVQAEEGTIMGGLNP